MLNYSCKKVLNCLISFKKNNIDIEGIISFEPYLSKNIINKLDLILKYLSNNGYLDYRYADEDIYDISLTYKGLDYKSFNLINLKTFLFKSILVPIIISVLTTLLTTWLQHLK